ncbi:MAG: acyl-CoA dehydrogenase [Porticoccaceae bacterium]
MAGLLYELILFLAFAAVCSGLVFLAFTRIENMAGKYAGAFVAAFVALVIYHYFTAINWIPKFIAIVLVIKALVVFLPALRRLVFMRPLLSYFRAVLPPMSDTEREALEAGTVWWEPELFSGNPDWKKLVEASPATLTAEEQAFLDGPVEEICQQVDDWKVSSELMDLPPEIWKALGDNGFFGMIIPKQYGGLEFSAYAHSAVVMKVASRSGALAVTTMVPNSLGPGQLLLEYGTEQQRDYYLPRLSKGEDIPCFALTEPTAGSDAAGMLSEGVVCKQQVDGKETLGIRLNWNKRYITLAPVATVLGLAFKLYDPEGLLGEQKDLGITLALIPTKTPGVEIGNRHMPIGTPFMNGPIIGRDVFITMDQIIGGQDRVGQGWRMLMECLSDGRGISLPSLSVAAGKFASMHTGAYSRIRTQFNLSIGDFEGVQEALAKVAGNTYLMDAVRCFTAATIDMGEKPSVASAIAKYHLTERMRQTVNAAVDIHGGSAICMGPRNPMGRSYQGIPISITVEGANILTRSLIIFGQGSVRSHPWILKSMQASANPDKARGLADFDESISHHVTMFMCNLSKSVLAGFNESLFTEGLDGSPADAYYRKLSHMSASFGLIADVMMLRFGGDLKRLEYYSGLLGDLLSYLYMGSAVLKHYHNRGETQEDRPLLEWSMHECFRSFHIAMNDILGNRPLGPLTTVVRRAIYPLGAPGLSRSRAIETAAAKVITRDSDLRNSLIQGIFIPTAEDDPVARMERTFHLILAAEEAEKKFHRALRDLKLDPIHFEDCVQQVLAAGKLAESEAQLVRDAHTARMDAIQVDNFDHNLQPLVEDAKGDAA